MDKLLEDKLKVLASDKVMIQAISAVIKEKVDNHKPIIIEGQNDELLGQKYRAYELAKTILNGVMTSIELYEQNKKENKTYDKSE